MAVDKEDLTNKNAIEKAMRFLAKKQRKNGGWGESFRSCENKDYCESGDDRGEGGSNVVQVGYFIS